MTLFGANQIKDISHSTSKYSTVVWILFRDIQIY